LKDWLRHWLPVCCLACALLGTDAAAPSEAAARPALWFPVGEAMVYRLYWGIIPVGESHVTTRWIERDGRTLLVIRFTSRSNKVLQTVYPVEDVMESIIDPETFLPLQFIKNLSEGRYRAHEITRFDHAAGKAYMTSLTNGKEKTYDIESDSRDLVSFMYFMRKFDLVPGAEFQQRVVADEDIYDILVRPLKYEAVKTVDGDKIESIKVEPKAKFDGLFVRKGEAWLWVSCDAERIVTRIVAEVPVANVKIILDQRSLENPEPEEDDVTLYPMPPWLKDEAPGGDSQQEETDASGALKNPDDFVLP